MDKFKIIALVIIILLMGIAGAVIMKFQNENVNLTQAKQELEVKVQGLSQEKTILEDRFQEAASQRDAMSGQFNQMRSELDRLQKERNEFSQYKDYKDKYEAIREEKKYLVEELQKKTQELADAKKAASENTPVAQSYSASTPSAPASTPAASSSGTPSDDYWADIVRARAELEAQVGSLTKELVDSKTKIITLEKEKQMLTLRIDEINNEKIQLQQEMDYKNRSLEIMSRDLVNERSTRKQVSNEISRLRSDNITLKREYVLASKEKLQVQNDMKSVAETKDSLERKLAEIENVFKEKSMALGELQDQLQYAIKDGKSPQPGQESASVQLPPIVVKSDINSSSKGLKGTVIAVNQEEKFIVVDMGEASGARPGMRFSVMRSGKEIGMVEIIETRKDISAADVKEVAGGAMVQEGDTVVIK